MSLTQDIQHFMQASRSYSIPVLLDNLQSIINKNILAVDSITDDLIDLELFDEIRNLIAYENIPLYFGTSLKDIKCIILDNNLREHAVFIKYKGPQKLIITSVNMPYSPIQDREYTSIEDIINAFRRHVDELASYFYELERIDRYCSVMEPAKPTFKDEYRRILLDDRIWLHVEVTPDGAATNIHLVGQSEDWNNKLQHGLLTWDHDKEIIDNILIVFDLTSIPVASKKFFTAPLDNRAQIDIINCSICLCAELPDKYGMPLPLCHNIACGAFFHRICLFQWLVSCSGGRPPTFGVATGNCPACFDSIACCERDD